MKRSSLIYRFHDIPHLNISITVPIITCFACACSISPLVNGILSYVSTYFIHGTARTRVTRILGSGIQNRVRSNSALAETALGEESLYIYSYLYYSSICICHFQVVLHNWLLFEAHMRITRVSFASKNKMNNSNGLEKIIHS